jgi:nanoRNase/pAp phosphatase (c-di-AMP/oligoRNAs hydrolase)
MRVLYRGDLDGTICAAMLLELDLCDELKQVHPTDMQHGKVDVTNQDIICNLPYHPDCYMWFDHHTSELNKVDFPTEFEGLARVAPSAARLIYDYYESDLMVLSKYEDLIEEIDLYDSGFLTGEQVKQAHGVMLLAFLLDPRTGLGLTHDFSVSNYQWSTQIPELLTMYSVDEILEMRDTRERVERYREQENAALRFYAEVTSLVGYVIACDTRGKDVPVANRFLMYTLPHLSRGNISVRISDGKKGEFHAISVGHNIFNRTSQIDASEICERYDGGGHVTAAACQVSLEDSDRIFGEIIEACQG